MIRARDGTRWQPVPARLVAAPKAARRLSHALLLGSGRTIEVWHSQEDLDRRVAALWSGDQAIEVLWSDRQFEEFLGLNRHAVRRGARELEALGCIRRSARGPARRIRLCLPADEPYTPFPMVKGAPP